ncbi:hypothetical protein NL676_024924 [Syzygium grande]|nr:hypothetical protein NL676_024924 [Syzygium grande]
MLRLDSDERGLPSPPTPPQQQKTTVQSRRLKGGLPARCEEAPKSSMCGSSWKASTSANQNWKTSSPRQRGLLRGLVSINAKTPLKFMNQIGSLRKANT